jgi:hypothetical protein
MQGVEKYKSEATELERQIQKLGQEVNELRKTNTSLVKDVAWWTSFLTLSMGALAVLN